MEWTEHKPRVACKMAGIEDRDDAMLSVKEAATYSLLHLSDDERVRMHPFMAQALEAQVPSKFLRLLMRIWPKQPFHG